MSKKPIIFCDFDGTVTNNDNIIAIMKNFNPPGWEQLKDQVLAQEISIKEGVGKMFSLLPSEKKQEVTEFVLDQAEIRPGFEEFVAYTAANNIKLLIVSGGIDFFVHPLLEPYNIPEENIFCNGSDFNGESIEITWPHSCDGNCENECGCCKPSILRNYDSKAYHKIVIGDSITDLQAAKQADEVFARDFLLEKCKALLLNYQPFETFYDVIELLKEREEELV
ncbi:2-hydroxy-3-keto-5-methylthiopentenyl-1-phosphate phosphatase [Pseudalkalibacillus caeni]|uniref:2-hydroxy-3-keto-5-methylthiopentenyl-1-phosphate phosphatase n=1 Tax=Exobacillus caeni TaxID=2574798 RepID=A0A5R9FFF5_9BACL|nr:2-hydroxy-3-keto-5-methylthiopentenyl-1-phosphate phosphatase [Pseudalkalibacillus caeni]TLS38305.1 2-hydroxy-3-keto-5-methylthiopentenyl-1-phosphate phosphatase [Pseudalkalibacillus caeni]